MDTKPIDESALNRIIPITWWESTDDSKAMDKEEEQRKKSYLTSCKKIHLGVKGEIKM